MKKHTGTAARRQTNRTRFSTGRGIYHLSNVKFQRTPDDLPNELLEEIFCFAQKPSAVPSDVSKALACLDPLFPWPEVISPVVRSRITLVSKRWQAVLNGSSRTWQDVDIFPQLNVDALPAVILRSAQRPIHVRGFLAQPSPGWGITRPLDIGVPAQCDLIQRAFATLAKVAPRWESLTLFAQETAVIQSMLESLDRHVYPLSLSSFLVINCGANIHPTTYHTLYTFPPVACISRLDPTAAAMRSVSTLTLRGCRADWTVMRTVFGPSILSLTLEYVYDPVAIKAFVSGLAECTSLQTLRLAGSFIRIHNGWESLDDPMPPRGCALVSLTTLCVSDMQTDLVSLLMQRVDMPSLRDLRYDLPYSDIPQGNPDLTELHVALASDILHFEPSSVRALTLRRFGLRLPILPPLLEHNFFLPFRGLTSLQMDFRFLQIEFWEWLLAGIEDAILPKLSTLTVAGLSVVCIQEYISLRHQAGLPPIHVVVVTDDPRFSFILDINHPSSLLWLRRYTLSCTLAEC